MGWRIPCQDQLARWFGMSAAGPRRFAQAVGFSAQGFFPLDDAEHRAIRRAAGEV